MRKVFLFFSIMVSLSQYRGTVGTFNNIFENKRCIRTRICYRRKIQSREFSLIIILLTLVMQLLISYLVVILRKIQVSRRTSDKRPLNDFSQMSWCLNSLIAHNFRKVALLKTYLPVQRFEIFCISETYLNSSITEDNGTNAWIWLN